VNTLRIRSPTRQGLPNVTITRLGSNPKLAEGWDAAFGGKKAAAGKKEAPAAKTPAKKAASKKATPAKKSKKK